MAMRAESSGATTRWEERTMLRIGRWFLARWIVLLAPTVLGAFIVAACGGGGSNGGGGGNNCSVTGVTVAASQGTVAANAMTTLTATVNASSSCSNAVTWTVSPAGGTLVANGSTATFTAPSAGTYTITATS